MLTHCFENQDGSRKEPGPMTNFPDSESSEVCPGHIPENSVPEHGCTIQHTTDTGLSTAEGEALLLASSSRKRNRTGLE